MANFVQLTQVDAFSRWTLSDWLTEPLPIELLSFNAVAVNDQVDLTWVTASEINNDYFTVERSADAHNFQALLNKDGAGNSSGILHYADVDYNPLSGISYYRLRQTDFNGSHTYSQLVPVNFITNELNSVQTWVNASENIAVQLQSRERDVYRVELFDSQGKLILSQTMSVQKGVNTALIPNSGLAAGVYLLRFTGEKGDVFVDKLMLR